MRSLTLLLSACVLISRADFPTPYDSQKDDGKRMSAAEVASTWRVPEGFKVSVFAADPDVQQPIAACWDARGRLWVAENYTYAQAGVEFDLALNDRIVIFEDKDNDGKHDTRTVFADNLKMLTSVELGGGGVYALCPPQLLWIPVKDDKPSGPPVVLLDGFDTVKGNRHTFANGLKWGPDGWLYGRVGISSPCRVGAPGSPEEGRVRMRGGIWRFHPTRKVFEAVCHGTTNPWGMDWNEDGEGFFTNTVIGHVWHMIPGAHFKRMHGEDVNPRCYEFIDQIADHYHFDTGKGWTSSRNAGNGSDELGGGHAHCGALIYKGTNWPEYWRGKLLTLNLHGRRINVERLERSGCTYVAKHEPDAFFCPDPWFRGIDLLEGPDGGVFVLDWSDTGECHEHDGVHRGSGRIYKIVYGQVKTPNVGDVSKLSIDDLVALASGGNPWTSAMSIRLLGERSDSTDKVSRRLVDQLRVTACKLGAEAARMKAFRTLSVLNETVGLLEESGEFLRKDGGPSFRAVSGWPWSSAAESVTYARLEPSALVRLHMAASLRHAPPAEVIPVTLALASRSEEACDPVLALHLWQQIAVHVPHLTTGEEWGKLAWPKLRMLWARKTAEEASRFPGAFASMLRTASTNLVLATDLLAGVDAAWQGRRNVPKPPAWDDFVGHVRQVRPVGPAGEQAQQELMALLQRLSTRFGGQASLDEFREIARDGKRDSLTRNQALQSLVEARAVGLHELCQKLVGDSALAATAARGLALSEDPAVGPLLAGRYKWSDSAKPVFLEVLASRPAWARALLEAIGRGDIAARDLPVFLARQIAALPDEAVRAKLKEVWGEVRADSAEARRKIAGWKERLTPEVLAKADPVAGRKVFEQSCAACHKLFGAGGEIGPDLTGGGRRNLDYLLDNVVDPSAVVANEHRVSVVTLLDGRVLNGALSGRTEPVHTLRTLAGIERIAREDVRSVEDLPFSLMPEGLLDALSAEQVRDLVGYLMR